MKILVANLGSTSFKYRLFDMDGQRQLAAAASSGSARREEPLHGPDRRALRQERMLQARRPRRGRAPLPGPTDRPRVGLPPRRGRGVGHRASRRSTAAAAAACSGSRPTCSPPWRKCGRWPRPTIRPYIAAMRLLAEKLPQIPLVAAFETDFHADDSRLQPLLRRALRVGRAACLRPPLGLPRRQPSLHRRPHGRAARPQRSADHLLPPGRLQFAVRHPQRPERGHEHGHEPAERPAAEQPRGRFRPLRPAADHAADRQVAGRSARRSWPTRAACWASAASAATIATSTRRPPAGNARAQLALDVFAASVRHYLGAYLVELGGADVIVFTGGIGENGAELRDRRLPRAWPSWASCSTRPPTPAAQGEARINAAASRVQVWVVPTNEELVVARQAAELLEGANEPCSSPKSPARWSPRRKSTSMVGHKLLVVEPYRLDPQDRQRAWSPPAARSWPSTPSARAKANSC